MECAQKKGSPPTLIVVILPEGGNDIYTAVKQCVFSFTAYGSILTVIKFWRHHSKIRFAQYMLFNTDPVVDGCRYAMHEKSEVL